MKRFADDTGVSDIIGTVLVLSLTVAAFGGLSLVVMDQVAGGDQVPRADIQVQAGTGGFVVQHRGGEAIRAADVDLIIYTTAGAKSCSLSAIPAIGSNGLWDIGETLELSSIYTADGSEAITGVQVLYTGGPSAILSSAGSTTGASSASCSSSTHPTGPGSVKPIGAGQACRDLDNNGICDGNDELLTIGPIPDCHGEASCVAGNSIGVIVTDPASGLIIPASTGTIDNNGGGNLYFQAPKNVMLDADLITGGGGPSGGDITIRSTSGNVDVGGKSVANGQGDIIITAAGSIDATDANLRANGNQGEIVLTAGQNIVLTRSTLDGTTTTITANGGRITQTDALFVKDQPANTASACVIGALKPASLSWASTPTQCPP